MGVEKGNDHTRSQGEKPPRRFQMNMKRLGGLALFVGSTVFGGILHHKAQKRAEIEKIMKYDVQKEDYKTRLWRALTGADFDLSRKSKFLDDVVISGVKGKVEADDENQTFTSLRNGKQERWNVVFKEPQGDVVSAVLVSHPECEQRLMVHLLGEQDGVHFEATLTFTQQGKGFECVKMMVELPFVDDKPELFFGDDIDGNLASLPQKSQRLERKLAERRQRRLQKEKAAVESSESGLDLNVVWPSHRKIIHRLAKIKKVVNPKHHEKDIPVRIRKGLSDQVLEAFGVKNAFTALSQDRKSARKRAFERLRAQEEKSNNFPDEK